MSSEPADRSIVKAGPLALLWRSPISMIHTSTMHALITKVSNMSHALSFSIPPYLHAFDEPYAAR